MSFHKKTHKKLTVSFSNCPLVDKFVLCITATCADSLWRCCQTRHLAFSIQYCCCQYTGTVEWEHAGWRHDPAKRPKATGTTLVYGHASLQKLAANTDKNLQTRVHMFKMHMLDRMLAEKHIINAVFQQAWPVGGHDLPGDPCMSPPVPEHAHEYVCVY